MVPGVAVVPVEVRVQGVQWVVDEPQEQERVVGDCERLEEGRRHRGALVLLEDQIRHDVTEESDQTHRDTDDRV